MTYTLVVAAVISGVATVATMTGGGEIDIQTILNLLFIDGIILLLLGLFVAKRLVTIWQDRRKGQAGAGLHVRLVMLFGLVAVTPAILVAVFSAIFINYGLNQWFNKRVNTAVYQSRVVAEAYLQEHRKNIYADAYAIASELNFNAPALGGNKKRFNRILSRHAALRSLSEVLVIDRTGQVMARSELSFTIKAQQIPKEAFEKASREEITILGGKKDERIRAIVRLPSFIDAYLLVERHVDPQVIKHIQEVDAAVGRYQAIEKKRGGIQVTFVMIFIVVAVLLLLAAIWIGLTVSTQLAKPISSLISAAEKISGGDLSVRVDTTDSPDEISTLSRTFNTMTSQLHSTQEGLIDANRQLDERRRFTETVLAGVSAGVIGLDKEGHIHLPNRSASELLSRDLESFIGQKLAAAVPEMADLLAQAMDRPERPMQAETKVGHEGQFQTLMVTVAAERLGVEVIGYVVTFDDVTELFSAQRKAAWADVARRIAHEIKNPLTPIQLSAERLKRKYFSEIKSDPETFANCTDTIVRQVEDLHRMVDEFSSFARMPELSLRNENLSEICRNAISLERHRHPEIDYDADLSKDEIRLYCDHRQVSRALTNLLKNATESIAGLQEETGSSAPKGEIRIVIDVRPGEPETGHKGANAPIITVNVEDNGRGLPGENREQLTEPYVTTRTKGTGLGLAIVKKIMEDHKGNILLKDREGGGAIVSLVFPPLDPKTEPGGAGDEESDPMKVATNLLAHGL
ncbi:MAG: PAS domain-containing sensor histidine kinase [Rhodospirillales bacterium]|nr:PAS domain-containing sensor histidine kinase [Rhodospirillales bacterium]